MAERLDELFFEVSVRKGPGADKALNDTAKAMKQTEVAAKGAASGMAATGTAAAAATPAVNALWTAMKRLFILLGGIAIIRSVVKGMVDFETRISEISTIATGGAEQVGKLRTEILALSQSVPQSAEELGAGAYQILSSDITKTADVLDVLEASAKAAVGGLTNTETAVDAITTVINAFQISASEATHVADVMFKTVQLGKLRFGDIAANIGNAATSAALAGVSFEELSAGMAVLTQRGIFAAEATTSLNRLFLTLTQQTEEQRRAFKDLGVEFSTSTVKERGFAGLLEEINKLTEGQIDALSELFPNIRAARAAFVLAGSGTKAFRETLEKLRNAEGASQQAFEKMNATFANQGKLLRNNLMVIFQEMAQSLLPAMSTGVAFLSRMVQTLTGWAKRLGANFYVIGEILKEVNAAGAVQIGSLIAYIKGKLADFLEFTVRIAQGVQRFLHLPEDAPYVRALQGMASAARESEEASLGLLAAEEARLARAKQAVEFAKQAAEATYEEVAAEQEFNRTKEEQDRLMRQGLELKEAEARLLKEQEERRQQLVSDLQTQVRQSLLTAAEQGIVAVQALRDAWIKEFGGISDVAEQMFNAIEAKAREALSQERAEELAQGYRDALEQGLERIDFAYIGVEDETGKLEAQRSVIEGIRDAVRKRLAFTENTREEEDALRKLLLEIEAILDRINKKEEKSSKEDNKNAEERLRNLQATLSLIRQAVDGALQLAQAFGLVNDETAKVIRSLEQIGEGAATLALGLSTGNVGGIVSGALGVIGGVAGLFGGGESPEEKRRRETLAKNTEAIEKLTREIGNFGANVTGAEFATLQRLLTNANQARLNEIGNARGIFGTGLANIHFRDNVISNLAALGLSMEDLERIAKELGITFADDVPTAQELLQVMEAMAQTELTRFAQDYTSQLAALRAEFELFDITDPLEQLQKLRQLASAQGATAFAPVFQGLDLNREADRAAAERRLQDLFRQLQQGTLSPEQLGGLTPEQFLQLLLEADKLLKAAGEGGLAGGTTQDVRQQVSITELQANQLLAYQSTLVFRAEERNQLLGNILNTLQTGLALTPPEIGTTTGGTVVRVDVSVGPNQFDVSTDDPTSVDQIAEDLAQAIGARLQEQDVLLGVRR